MAINLKKGQRVSLDNGLKLCMVGLGWDINKYDGGADFDLDASVFMLGANGKLLRDDDFIFYNNLESRNGAVKHTGDDRTGGNDGDDEQIIIDLDKVPPEIEKLAIQAGKAMNINFATIDIIQTVDNNMYVMEMNSGVCMDIFTKLVDGGYEMAKDIYRKALQGLFE